MAPYKNEGIAIIILFILLFVPDKENHHLELNLS